MTLTTNILIVGLLALISVMTTIILLARKDVLNLGLIVRQVTSGRWLLTVSAGACLLIATISDAWIAAKALSAHPEVTISFPTAAIFSVEVALPFPVSTIFTLIGMVFTFYFMKKEQDKADDAREKHDKLLKVIAEKLGLSDEQPPLGPQSDPPEL